MTCTTELESRAGRRVSRTLSPCLSTADSKGRPRQESSHLSRSVICSEGGFVSGLRCKNASRLHSSNDAAVGSFPTMMHRCSIARRRALSRERGKRFSAYFKKASSVNLTIGKSSLLKESSRQAAFRAQEKSHRAKSLKIGHHHPSSFGLR